MIQELNTLTLLELIQLACVWYGIGAATVLLSRMFTNGELRVKDLDESLKYGLFGPLLYVFYILEQIYKIVCWLQNILTNHQDMVLWRSKRKKTEHILYGKSDKED